MNKRTAQLQKMEKKRKRNWEKEQIRRRVRKGLKQACRILAKDTKALKELTDAYIKGGKNAVAKDTGGVQEDKGIRHSDR